MPNNLGEQDSSTDVGTIAVAENHAQNTDEPDGGVYSATRCYNEPLRKNLYPTLLCQGFDEDELREGEWNQGKRKSGNAV